MGNLDNEARKTSLNDPYILENKNCSEFGLSTFYKPAKPMPLKSFNRGKSSREIFQGKMFFEEKYGGKSKK